MAIEGLEQNGYISQAWNYLNSPAIEPKDCIKLKICGIACLIFTTLALTTSALPLKASVFMLFTGTTTTMAGYTGKPIYLATLFSVLFAAATFLKLTTHVRGL